MKIIIAGDCRVGKTTLTKKLKMMIYKDKGYVHSNRAFTTVGESTSLSLTYSDDEYDDNNFLSNFDNDAIDYKTYTPTIGCQYYPIDYNKSIGSISLIDVSGNNQYKSITSSVLSSANKNGTSLTAIALVYDVSNRNSFNNIFKHWLLDVNNAKEKVSLNKYLCILIGNGIDKIIDNSSSKDYVTHEEQVEKAERFGITLNMRTSAVSGVGVTQAFRLLLERLEEVKEKQIKASKQFDNIIIQTLNAPSSMLTQCIACGEIDGSDAFGMSNNKVVRGHNDSLLDRNKNRNNDSRSNHRYEISDHQNECAIV